MIRPMEARRYNEFCALATALDVVGERWTLLVVRELLLGPKRYSDLRDGLPGIASNLLATRLRTLEQNGLVRRRRLPRPAASTVYELTDVGRELEPAMLDLMRWGSRWMTRPEPDTVVRASWFALALKSLLPPASVGDAKGDIELVTEDEVIHLHVADGAIEVASEPVEAPDARTPHGRPEDALPDRVRRRARWPPRWTRAGPRSTAAKRRRDC